MRRFVIFWLLRLGLVRTAISRHDTKWRFVQSRALHEVTDPSSAAETASACSGYQAVSRLSGAKATQNCCRWVEGLRFPPFIGLAREGPPGQQHCSEENLQNSVAQVLAPQLSTKTGRT